MKALSIGLVLCTLSACGGTSKTEALAQQDDPAAVVLEQKSLRYFSLPINSARWAVAGYAASKNLCVTAIWDYSNNGMNFDRHCDDFFPSFPYVVMRASQNGGVDCDDSVWDYGSETQMLGASGCVEFEGLTADAKNAVDVEIHVSDVLYEGKIRVAQ